MIYISLTDWGSKPKSISIGRCYSYYQDLESDPAGFELQTAAERCKWRCVTFWTQHIWHAV